MKVNKKGQLGTLYTGVTTIAAIGILTVLILYVLSSMGDSLQIKNVDGTAIINEAGYINQTGYTLAQSARTDFSPTITAWNVTSGQTILSGNYTVTDGLVRNATSTNWNTVKFNYTYTYTIGTAASNSTDTLISLYVDFLPWLGIILLVLAAGVVLFFVIRSFGGGKGV